MAHLVFFDLIIAIYLVLDIFFFKNLRILLKLSIIVRWCPVFDRLIFRNFSRQIILIVFV